MSTAAIVCAIIAVLVLAVIVYAIYKNPRWAEVGYWRSHLFESPWDVYRRSNGGFDDAARLALRRATGRAEPTPAEHGIAATILARNVLGQAPAPVALDREGRPTAAAAAAARERRAAYDAARHHFERALEGFVADGGRREPPGRPPPLGAPFVIDGALAFAFEGAGHAAGDDWLLAALLFEHDELWGDPGPLRRELGPGVDLEEMIQVLIRPDAGLVGLADVAREQTVRQRRGEAQAAAAAHGGGRRAATAAYVRLAQQQTNDPQNTHDPGVLACLRAVVARLRADQGPVENLPTVDAIIAEIRKRGDGLSEGRPRLIKDAVEVAERAKAGENVMGLGATDGECLRRVWARADDPRNAANAGSLRQAVFDALCDCWEDGMAIRHIVCVNGRTTRFLAALVLLDWDERNWALKKLEQFKNDVFERAAAVIDAEARAAAADPDAGRRAAGRAYLAATPAEAAAAGAVPPEAAAALAATMRAAIARMVADYLAALEASGVRDAIPSYQVEAVVAEAQAAVTD